MICNNPQVADQDFSVDLLCRLAEIDNIIALKDSSTDVAKLYETPFRLGGRFAIFSALSRTIMSLDYQRRAKGLTMFGNWGPAYGLR